MGLAHMFDVQVEKVLIIYNPVCQPDRVKKTRVARSYSDYYRVSLRMCYTHCGQITAYFGGWIVGPVSGDSLCIHGIKPHSIENKKSHGRTENRSTQESG